MENALLLRLKVLTGSVHLGVNRKQMQVLLLE